MFVDMAHETGATCVDMVRESTRLEQRQNGAKKTRSAGLEPALWGIVREDSVPLGCER